MKLQEMAVLVRVAQTRSMTRAAAQLNVTPAAVSATIRRVEEALGVRVFARTTRTLRPTDEGEIVLQGCRDVLERWQRTVEDTHGGDATGTVHISAPADTAYQVLSQAVVSVSQSHPDLGVVVHATDSPQKLNEEAIDMAIRYGPLQDSGLVARRLTQWPGILVAAPSYLERRGTPTTPEDLVEHTCITLQLSDAPVHTWVIRSGDKRRRIELRSPLCADGFLSRQWASEGVGIARKSLFDVVDDLEAGRLVRVLPSYSFGWTTIHAVFPNGRYIPPRVRVLDEAIQAMFHERSKRCEGWLGPMDDSTPLRPPT